MNKTRVGKWIPGSTASGNGKGNMGKVRSEIASFEPVAELDFDDTHIDARIIFWFWQNSVVSPTNFKLVLPEVSQI
ncbi:MAG: hypothetical protein ACRC62_06820 [Microcoleus sp.]